MNYREENDFIRRPSVYSMDTRVTVTGEKSLNKGLDWSRWVDGPNAFDKKYYTETVRTVTVGYRLESQDEVDELQCIIHNCSICGTKFNSAYTKEPLFIRINAKTY